MTCLVQLEPSKFITATLLADSPFSFLSQTHLPHQLQKVGRKNHRGSDFEPQSRGCESDCATEIKPVEHAAFWIIARWALCRLPACADSSCQTGRRSVSATNRLPPPSCHCPRLLTSSEEHKLWCWLTRCQPPTFANLLHFRSSLFLGGVGLIG